MFQSDSGGGTSLEQRTRRVTSWSLTTLREKLVKIGARIVHHGRYLGLQRTEVVVPRPLESCPSQ